jgi:hypothetical protein
MMDTEAWALERRLWLGGVEVYDALLGKDCVMAFPSPVGILKGDAITASLSGAPRWSSVMMSEKVVSRADADTLALGYRAEGRREGLSAYLAYCTSTYRRISGGWKLIQHQQTPIG